MRVNTITLKGVTRYSEEIKVDLAGLGPGLVAITGANGAGKTTLLEAPVAALHLEFPSRPGAVSGVCHGKDAKIELELENGQPYRALVAVDAVLKTPKTEAYLFNGSGPVVSGKVRDYRQATGRIFGSQRLMLSAMIASQNKRGSFLQLSKAERKDLLAEILDTGGLQELSEAARARAKDLEGQINVLAVRKRMTDEELQRLAGLQPDMDQLRERLATLTERGAELESRAEELRAMELAAREELAAIEAQSKTLAGLEHERDRLHEDIAAKRHRAETMISEAKAEAARLEEYRGAELALAGMQQRYEEAANSAEAAAREVADAQDRMRKNHAEEIKAREEIKRLTAELDRATRAAELVGSVPCSAVGEFASCPLIADSATQAARLDHLREAVARAERVAATLRETAFVAASEAEAAEARRRDLVARAEAIRSEIDALRQKAVRIEVALQAEAQIRQAGEMLDEVTNMQARVEALDVEIGRLEDAGLRSAEIKAEIASVGEEMRGCRAEIERVELRRENVQRDLLAAEERAARRRELQETYTELMSRLAETKTSYSEWRVLERALGRDGIQALEIDAAGPELSGLTTDLLHGCFGERFDVKFITQLPKRSGDGFKEVFDIQIIDNERGREGSIDSLSGGEKTVISEAISLALAIYVARHSGRRFETLFRDETAGALDPENAHRYVQMLRRAKDISGAYQIVFIAQQPEVWQQADAVIALHDGRADVAV